MELSGFDAQCRSLLDASPKHQSRHCFRNAFHHLECAEKLTSLDPSMAVFRALTAEEEAASGLMHCLKERGYSNAELLRPRDHVHKNAAMPFLAILGNLFGEIVRFHNVEPKFHLKDVDGERRLTLLLPIVIGGKETWAYPIPPLNFAVSSEEKRLSYKRQIAAYIAAKGAKDILSYLREQANARNRVLYASPKRFPALVEVPADFFAMRQARVLVLLRAYLFIYPYAEQQPFVQDALDAFLAMLGTLKTHELHEEV